MKKGISLFLALLTLLLCACTRSWQEEYDMGQQYLLEGNYEEAITSFSSAIKVDPDKAEAYVGRGDAYVGLGNAGDNLASALEDYRTSLKLDDNDLPVYLKIADIHIANDEYEPFQEVLGQAREKFGETAAILDCEKKFKTYENYYNIGARYLQNGDYGDAISAFTTAIELDSGQAGAYVGRGDAYTNLGDTDEDFSSALIDYETALTLDKSDLTVYLKIADAYISKENIYSAQEVLNRASENFINSEEILERERVVQEKKDAKLAKLLMSNAWDTSWQTNEYHVFFSDLQGIRLVGGGSPGISYTISTFSYSLENGKVMINEGESVHEWTFDEVEEHFVNMVEEYGDVFEQLIDPIPLQNFFTDMATIPDNEVISGSYWDDLLELTLLCKQKSSDESTISALQKEQESWQSELSQEIDSQGIDTKTQSGSAWKNYYVKQRIFELLELPFDDSNPPAYKPLLSEDEAKQIAMDFWNVSPGDIDEETGYEIFVSSQDAVETQSTTYYCFRLYWMVTDGYLHPSTLDIIYVDAQTGVCQRNAP